MASVTPRKTSTGVTWRVQFRVDGKMRQESFPNPEGADQFAGIVDRVGGKAALEVLARRQTNQTVAPTLREWTHQYLDIESGILTGIQVGTRTDYGRIAELSFLPQLGDLPIDAVTKEDIGRWVAWQETQTTARGGTIAAKTVANRHALLSNVFKAAQAAGLRPDNPAHRTRLTAGPAREPVFLSHAEFASLYGCIPDYYKPLVAFLIGSQCRWSEATALQWGDLTTETVPPTVRIVRAWKKNPGGTPYLSVPKTKRGRRTISLWPALVDLLGDRGPGDNFIFQGKLNHERVWYNSFNNRVWRPAVLRSGLERQPRIHDLRHTGASWLIADGMPLPFIQARLGHESITTTVNIYGHVVADAHTRMADSLEAGMSATLGVSHLAVEGVSSEP